MFGDKLIRNGPYSPDIAYPNEALWAELKKRIKSRNSKNAEELKERTIEEWNIISKDYIKKLFNNFIQRYKKIIELKGGRLEPEYLREIRKEEIEEEKDKNMVECEKIDLEEQKQKLKLKLVYSISELIKKAKKLFHY